MVKITFQSVAGQKVEKENDGDKSEILIPHAVVSVFLTRFISIIVREKKPACLSSAYRPTYTCAAMISWWGWGWGYMHVSHSSSVHKMCNCRLRFVEPCRWPGRCWLFPLKLRMTP